MQKLPRMHEKIALAARYDARPTARLAKRGSTTLELSRVIEQHVTAHQGPIPMKLKPPLRGIHRRVLDEKYIPEAQRARVEAEQAGHFRKHGLFKRAAHPRVHSRDVVGRNISRGVLLVALACPTFDFDNLFRFA